jgi:hypothetical protein
MLAPAGQCAWHFFYRRGKPHEAAKQEPPGMDKARVSVYIDGFNLYHSTLQYAHPDYSAGLTFGNYQSSP